MRRCRCTAVVECRDCLEGIAEAELDMEFAATDEELAAAQDHYERTVLGWTHD